MIREIIQIGDSQLLQKSQPINITDISSTENQQLYTDLVDTVDQDKLNSVGLSAVQIGVLKTVFVVMRLDRENEWEVLINPKVEVARGAEQSTFWEGCLSIGEGEKQIYGPVSRPDQVKVVYHDINGAEQEIVATSFFAHVLQHEYDHLHGKLFTTYVQDPQNLWLSKDLDDYLDEHGHYPEVS